MLERRRIVSLISTCLLVASVLLLGWTVINSRSTSGTQRAARKVERIVSARMKKLDNLVAKEANDIPSDMVIYRYTRDSLFGWVNRFPISNDDIAGRVFVSTLQNPRIQKVPPLSEVTDSLSFRNFGRKWYLVRMLHDQTRKTVYGLEIMDLWNRGVTNGVNPHLRLADRFTIHPLESTEGDVVTIGGIPQFKVVYDSLSGSGAENASLLILALALFVIGAVMFLSAHSSVRNFIIVASGVVLTMLQLYFWGRTVGDVIPIFSPLIYAASDVLYSLGAVLILNTTIFTAVVCLYLVRNSFKLHPALSITAVAGILSYCFLMIRSIILNSDICLELYKMEELSAYTGVVYLSFLMLMLCVPLLVKMSFPGVNSRLSRVLYSLMVGAFMLLVTSVLGLRREKDNLELWANRLAIERNINLELLLKHCESDIASDPMIAAAIQLEGSSQAIGNYVIENYLSRIAQDYDIAVFATRDRDNDVRAAELFEENVRGGELISENSHFLYASSGGGRIRYTGVFLYYNENVGLSRMLLGIEAKTNHEERGYNSILGFAAPGQVVVPSAYSYAKYYERNLQFSKGNFAYPTSLNEPDFRRLYIDAESGFQLGGYTHFVYGVADEEVVVMSRPSFGLFYYLVDGVFIALLMYLLISLSVSKETRAPIQSKNYYRRRISWILMLSLSVTLVSLVLVSVLFVYRRNDANKRMMMSDKINSIHSLIEGELRQTTLEKDGVAIQDVMSVIQNVARVAGTDITLYDRSGRVMVSTVPEIYTRLLLAGRIDKDAYDNIVGQNKRFFIHRELLRSKYYYCMYAPLYNASGVLQAVICAPYTDESYDFEKDAVMHSVTIVVVFLILLLIARVISATVVDKLFKPLSEMGRKMNEADLDNLEHISYDRDDELSSLVSAYNRMVDDLTDSSRKLAQAERDKAWSGMARQVAHEIKNPLTPMKLQLQRLIRLKQKGDPRWQDKFDEVSAIVLDHIDILSDTANEFSEIAKLPSEQMTDIDLDRLIPEEVSMFSGREGVSIDYIGLEKAVIVGPKPQLTRVIVNLLTNAVQAVEEVPDGRIMVSLRNSVERGYYDVVFEDNGPGVSDDNLDKLFVPNFTTKSSGSGLGLAISRSILERCNASISYSRSFALGGACFTIRYPRK